ncbi:protein nessun dorma isoform X2 [Uranotaenia lowii]|uniref:protein nessun dorma isoform X2 n=1 Tax=Uranotaenia lowii TaxID=190385 RepID=UPI002479CF87|nr:protein nessun dorma isoform X2 [Uranotaenia lowii]
MDIYEFEKSLLDRLTETSDVLSARDIIPANEVRTEWANYVEIMAEPTGWQAVWRIPRVVCEQLSIRFPIMVMGTVEQVLFDELKAVFCVEGVQDDDVHLPEKHAVALDELWPMKDQENEALNMDRTAECIDRLRFFYHHIWMPWDYDNDDQRSDWADKHLESRIKFYYDIKNRTMSKRLSSHVLALLAEANYIQKKKEVLEMEIEDEEETELGEDSSLVEHDKASELMKLHLRLNSIKNEIDILENPAMRELYEKVRFTECTSFSAYNTISNGKLTAEAFVVTHIGTLDEQIDFLTKAKSKFNANKVVRICDSLQGALDISQSSDEIYLPPGKHMIKFLEYLNGGGAIRAITSVDFKDVDEHGKLEIIDDKSIISSKDDDSILLTVDGNYCFENVLLDCRNVRTGVLIKRGNVSFKNCYLIGDPASTTKQGIVVFGNSTISLENCIIKDFSTGIYSNHNCNIHLTGTNIQNCYNGIEVLTGCTVAFIATRIQNCKSYGVLLEVNDSPFPEKTNQSYDDFQKIERQEFRFEPDCVFENNGKANFILINGSQADFNSSCFMDQMDPSSNKRKNMDD